MKIIICNHITITIDEEYLKPYQRVLAQSVGAVEYTDCFSAEG